MKANETNLNEFLAQSDVQFIIPVYQRNYDWTYSQCKQLLSDILEIGSSKDLDAHFLGSIVYVHDDVYSTADVKELTIIDGQQRLTTITLIYIALYQFAKATGKDGLAEKINETYLINKFFAGKNKLKLRPTKDNDEALKSILREDVAEFSGFSRIIDNFYFFNSKVNEGTHEIILKGIKKLMFVEISLDRNKDNPQRIFESLNSTGLELSQADLIRNYILMGLQREVQTRIYEDYWEVIERLAREELTNKSRVSDFIRDYLTLKNKKIPTKSKVYEEFKKKYPPEKPSILEKNLSEIKKFAKHYNKLLNPIYEQDKEIRKQLNYINKLEINVAYPFLIKVYDDYSNKAIDKSSFIEILEALQSFVWRRFIVGIPTNSLNKIFMRLHEDIDLDNYVDSIKIALVKKRGSQRFPNNSEVIKILKEKDIYNVNSKNRFYLFERIENFNSSELIRIEDNEKLTVEHIFPQNPHPKWKTDLGDEEYQLIKDSYLNTVANLTLSGNNGKLGNKPFSDKRDMNINNEEQGYKYSKLWLNRYLSSIDEWNLESLEKRFQLIAERFLEIWKFPDVDISEEYDFHEVNIFDAENPTGKKLEYAIFMDNKLEVTEVSKLYLEVMKALFESNPQAFFASDLSIRLNLSQNPDNHRQSQSLDDSYFIEMNIDNKGKFERIKQALTVFDLEDELTIKYKN